MTPAQFRAIFPEFTGATDALIQTRIRWAENRTPVDIWGEAGADPVAAPTLRDQGVATYAAHFLALLPEAKPMRKGEKPGESMYWRERQRLNLIVSSGYRTAGLPDAEV